MKTFKSLLSMILAICMLFALFAGCGKDTASSAEVDAAHPETSVTEPPETVPTADTPDASAVSTAEPASVEEPPQLNFPLTDTEEHLSMFYYYPPFLTDYTDDVAKTSVFEQMKELTGVTIDFQACILFAVQENFSLMVASEDYTDLVYGFGTYYTNGMDNAVEDNIIYPLNDYLKDGLMPNFQALLDSDDSIKINAMTDSGYYPVAPQILSSDYMPNAGMVIRQDYLDDVEMDSPITYDDWHTVLTAFKNKLNLEAPLTIPYYGSIFGDYLGAGFDVATYVQSSLNFYVVDGEVKLGAIEDGYKQYLETMHQWYAEGLIWQDFMSATEQMNYPDSDRVISGKTGIWYCDIDTMAQYKGMGDDPDFRVVGVSDPVLQEGNVNHLRKYSDADANLVNLGNGVAITTHCANPELAAQWLDAHFSPQGILILNYGGIEGETFRYDEAGKPVLTDLVVNNPDMVFNHAISYYCAKNYAGYYEYNRLSSIHTDDQKQATAVWAKADSAYGYPVNAYMTADETYQYSGTASDMVTLILENVVKFITGDRPISEYEDFRSELINMGTDDVIQIKQAAYDRYAERTTK